MAANYSLPKLRHNLIRGIVITRGGLLKAETAARRPPLCKPNHVRDFDYRRTTRRCVYLRRMCLTAAMAAAPPTTKRIDVGSGSSTVGIPAIAGELAKAIPIDDMTIVRTFRMEISLSKFNKTHLPCFAVYVPALRRRRRIAPTPSTPAPKNKSVAGSGTEVIPVNPLTVRPYVQGPSPAP